MKCKILVAAILAILFVSCAALQTNQPNYYVDKNGQQVVITDPAGQCVLYKILGTNSEYYKMGLFAASYGALKAKVYTSDQANQALNDIKSSVDATGATVGSVINTILTVAARASKIGAPEIILVTQGLGGFSGNTTPLDECTVYKLDQYIESQRLLVMSFK
jgi:hypothetical protein